MTDHARIEFDGHAYEGPVFTGTENEQAIDIRKLRSETGLVTYDPGYGNTGSVKSEITFIDGENGILRYRGYPIEQLCERSDFIETSYLLIYGDLPTREQLDSFRESITYHTLLREDMKPFFDAFPRDAHPMAILSAGTSAMSTFYQNQQDPTEPWDVEVSTYRLMAKLPTVAAFAYKRSIGQPYIYPRNDLKFAANFLHMMFAVPAEPYEVDPDLARALTELLILHAEHEQNCSTSTVRLVGSSQANMFASVSAGINALWGPLHGGANQRVVEMLKGIRDADGDTSDFIQRAKDPDDPFRLMGFGHRVYKNYDPRARIIKDTADRVIRKLAGSDPLFEIAQELEETALNDDYFVERRLYPNVDFYSGLIYRAMGLPIDMYPVLFALGRLPGWIAQWREMNADPDNRIGRPRQIYTGHPEREYRGIEERTSG
ncbi:citrate synthase [Egibacter rhizosphaerae]|uniref:Citrate synthase n=1 Tax=Egibacter rhizosphaerae TaxID=1670831 RepID=A0A411YAS3_9ACTN|nr:citrate synthase [Egibacter rhizosphaerae]QBI18296.1 citrate synthase [Egibacter rhizosphaerae]